MAVGRGNVHPLGLGRSLGSTPAVSRADQTDVSPHRPAQTPLTPYNPKLIQEDLYKQLGAEKLGHAEGAAYTVFPGIASLGLPAEEGEGLPIFDVAKATLYAEKLAKAIAADFVDPVERWESIASHHPEAR